MFISLFYYFINVVLGELKVENIVRLEKKNEENANRYFVEYDARLSVNESFDKLYRISHHVFLPTDSAEICSADSFQPDLRAPIYFVVAIKVRLVLSHMYVMYECMKCM